MRLSRATALLVAALLLGGCAAQSRVSADAPAAPGPVAGQQRYARADPAFRIDFPTTVSASTRFESHYLAAAHWRLYAPADIPGMTLLMLTLPKSDDVRAGELRIGASRDARARADCTTPPDAVREGTLGQELVDGVRFTRWQAADAAMSHRLEVHSYRTVREGSCWAIDLLVIGTNPAVYDPPRTPPFSRAEAFSRLRTLLHGFHFTP